MLKQIGITLSLVTLLSISSMAKNHGNGKGNNRGQQNQTIQTTVVDSELNSGLIFMAEEEKLARDTYLYLSDYWGSRIFSNIANSEQRHMDTVENLLNTYNLPVPSTMNSRGVFENNELQDLYNTLIAKGKISLVDALEVGVLIEETDIDDLKNLLSNDLPSDVETAYTSLLNGSYNHLNSFNTQLNNN